MTQMSKVAGGAPRLLVTGAGRGIGREAARALAGPGVRLALLGRTAPPLEALAAELARAGGESVAVPCDLSSREALAEAAARLQASWGGVDVLVHAAGEAASAPLARTDDGTWDRLMAVNATAAFLLARAFAPGMAERGFGRIVFVASTAGRAGFAYVSAYTASKHAVVGLTRALAAELAGRGVTVNAICPGYVDTDMTRRTIDTIVRTTGRTEEQARAVLLAANPQNRLITPEEVASVIAGLCRDEARGINGQAIVLDGGGIQR